jgi:hypothetical protein
VLVGIISTRLAAVLAYAKANAIASFFERKWLLKPSLQRPIGGLSTNRLFVSTGWDYTILLEHS